MKDVVLFQSPTRIRQSIKNMNQQEQLVYQYLDIVRNTILGDEGKALENETKILFDDWRPIREEVISLVRKDQKQKAAEITIGKGADHVAKLEEKILGLTNYARNKAFSFMSEAEETHSRVRVTWFIFLLSVMFTSSLIAFFTLKQAASGESALRESEEKYRSIMEAMNDAAYICSPDFRIEYMNPAMTKKTDRDAVGESCHKVIHGLDEKCLWCSHGEVMQGEYVKNEIVSPKGGEMEVTLKEVELGLDDLTDPSMTPGTYVCLTVADTGPGMDRSVISRIFDLILPPRQMEKVLG